MADAACNLDRRSLSRAFPGLRLVSALRLGFDFRKLVIAAIGLPGQAQAGSPQWQMQFQGSTHLLPFYSSPPRVHDQLPGSGTGGPPSQMPWMKRSTTSRAGAQIPIWP